MTTKHKGLGRGLDALLGGGGKDGHTHDQGRECDHKVDEALVHLECSKMRWMPR